MEEKDWALFFQEYEPLLERWISRYSAGVVREEAKQVARIACWQKLGLYNPERGASLSSYLFMVVRGALLNWYAQERRWYDRHRLLTAQGDEEEQEGTPEWEDADLLPPDASLVWEAWMAYLSEMEALCLTLHIRDGYSLRAVARRLNVPYERMKKCKQRALGKLRRALLQEWEQK